MAKQSSLFMVLSIVLLIAAIALGVLFATEHSKAISLKGQVALLGNQTENLSTSLSVNQNQLAAVSKDLETEKQATVAARTKENDLRSVVMGYTNINKVSKADAAGLTNIYTEWYESEEEDATEQFAADFREALEESRRHINDGRVFLNTNKEALLDLGFPVTDDLKSLDDLITAYNNALDKIEEYEENQN